MKRSLLCFLLAAGALIPALGFAQAALLNCDFTVPQTTCLHHEVTVTYTGGASANATYVWDFDSAAVLSGSGQGPYVVRWETPGDKNLSLTIELEGQTCTNYRVTHVAPDPEIFQMTGGGVVVPGGPGVPVGLSGSQVNVIYKLYRNSVYTGISVVGTGQPLGFGLMTEPGHYNATGRMDGTDCIVEMSGIAIVTLEGGGIPPVQPICMVTFDTISLKNLVVWNKVPSPHLSHFNIYRETFQNNHFEKIGEVPYNAFSTYADTSSFPLVKSDRYKLSVTDSAGVESEKCLPHKTIHLNISAGIYGFNLIWNAYEGYEFLTYNIYRKFGTGPYEMIAQVASNITSYTDFYSQLGFVTYYIEALRLEPCNPSLKETGYVSASSNYATATPMGVSHNGSGKVSVYPNPAEQYVNIELDGLNMGTVQARLISAQGQVLISQQVSAPKDRISLESIPAGLYFLQMEGNGLNVVTKIVKR